MPDPYPSCKVHFLYSNITLLVSSYPTVSFTVPEGARKELWNLTCSPAVLQQHLCAQQLCWALFDHHFSLQCLTENQLPAL